MKKIVLIGLILLNVLVASAQQFKINKDRKQLYLTHKVTAKETLFSLARLYNLSHKDIAAANKMDVNAGLKLGQHLRIPLNKSNFIQTSQKNNKGVKPVYHVIAKGDNLNKLSKSYNNVKEGLLKKWNKLTKSLIKPGQQLIVGYVKYDPANYIQESEAEKANSPVTKQKIDSPAIASKNEIEAKAISKAQENAAQQEEYFVAVNTVEGEGYFAKDFAVNAAGAQQRSLNGTAATFKSTSGWNDGRYYILINDIPAETIVKVTANGKAIYAKVLESLPSIRDNNGLICRLSNAAASALRITDTKFSVELVYSE